MKNFSESINLIYTSISDGEIIYVQLKRRKYIKSEFWYTHYFMSGYLGIFIQTWLHTFDIEGEASRKELVVFWIINFILVNIIIRLDIVILRYFAYIAIIPNITLIVRRLNSLEKSRKNVFLLFIPIVNLYLGMLLLSDGKKF